MPADIAHLVATMPLPSELSAEAAAQPAVEPLAASRASGTFGPQVPPLPSNLIWTGIFMLFLILRDS